MKSIRFTLIADGSSDKVLMNIIKWLLDDLFPKLPNYGNYCDLRMLQKPPKKYEVIEQVKLAEQYYPFDILFYHRDAESNSNSIVEERIAEVKKQLEEVYHPKTIFVIPVRMMESWLLFDEIALKKAAGNRNYNKAIELPSINKLEGLTNPKQKLHDLLKEVSGKKSRQLKNFNVHHAVHLVAENIKDFSPLRNLKAFNTFEENLIEVVSELSNNENHI